MKKRILGMLAMALGIGTLTLASDAEANNVKQWLGKPSFVQVGKAVAVYGWQDKSRGLHLRVTAPNRKQKPHHFKGTVCAVDKKGKNTIKTLTPKLIEKVQDSVKVGPKGHCVWFDFKNNGHMDGFDFTTDANHLWFTIFRDGKKVAPKDIYLGVKGVHPPKNPAIIKR